MKQKFDPNLREAMDDIRAILRRRNIAGHILLASDTHTEFGLLYDIPAWSAVSFEELPGGQVGLRIRAKKSNPGDQEKLESTMHMLCSFHDLMANGQNVASHLIDHVRKSVNVLHLNRIGVAPDSVPESDHKTPP